MKKYVLIATAAIALFSMTAAAQRVRLIDGNEGALKGMDKLNVKYDYNDDVVGKKSEKEYVDEKRDDYNKKEQGKGDKWVDAWNADKEDMFEPAFTDGFEMVSGMKIGKFPQAKYTLILKVIHTEPGFNAGFARKSASVDMEAWIVETGNQSHVVAKIGINNCPGSSLWGNDFDTGERLKEAYATAGRGLGRHLREL